MNFIKHMLQKQTFEHQKWPVISSSAYKCPYGESSNTYWYYQQVSLRIPFCSWKLWSLFSIETMNCLWFYILTYVTVNARWTTTDNLLFEVYVRMYAHVTLYVCIIMYVRMYVCIYLLSCSNFKCVNISWKSSKLEHSPAKSLHPHKWVWGGRTWGWDHMTICADHTGPIASAFGLVRPADQGQFYWVWLVRCGLKCVHVCVWVRNSW